MCCVLSVRRLLEFRVSESTRCLPVPVPGPGPVPCPSQIFPVPFVDRSWDSPSLRPIIDWHDPGRPSSARLEHVGNPKKEHRNRWIK